jgi:hypothetical protein
MPEILQSIRRQRADLARRIHRLRGEIPHGYLEAQRLMAELDRLDAEIYRLEEGPRGPS